MPSPASVPRAVRLDDAAARDPELTGSKASALAEAAAGGLPVLPGFVITTKAIALLASHPSIDDDPHLRSTVHEHWAWLTHGEQRAVIVRSSSTAEDREAESHAGEFTSVLGVRSWPDLVEAVGRVVASAGDDPMAVLVQPLLQPKWGGVLFGVDPVTRRDDRLVVAAVPGGPDRLVSGLVDGVHLVLSRHGRILETSDEASRRLLPATARRNLAHLSRSVESLFGGPQDIEWAIERDGRLVLLQSRPITTLSGREQGFGPVLGPGPVAETFGGPLARLEIDLWVEPLRDGLRRALTIAGAASRRQLAASPVVVTVGGHVAADLQLLGLPVGRKPFLARLDPRPPARRLVAAWRVGRLRAALPALSDDLLLEIDADLRSIPPIDTLEAVDLLRLLGRSRQTLTALHGYEALAGLLLDEQAETTTGAAVALRVLAEQRPPRSTASEIDRDLDDGSCYGAVDGDGDGASDEDLVARHPVLLALIAPSIERPLRLPTASPVPASADAAHARRALGIDDGAGPDVPTRELLRLRIRWVQELTARAARALGVVLVERGVVGAVEEVAAFPLERLAAVVAGDASVRRRPPGPRVEPGPPLPAEFQLSESGQVVPLRPAMPGAGRGAGGGRGVGRVHTDLTAKPPSDAVLVVRHLDPQLAGVLPGLAGLVAETGSVLSHLAILAREYGVPTVVGVTGALERFEPGTQVVVDGSTGEVAPVDDGERGAA